MQGDRLQDRARLHAALGDPNRLAVVDQLVASDRAPSELAAALGIDSNLLAHHLGVLERLGLIERLVSQGDRRRRYVRLVPASLADLSVGGALQIGRIVFVCTENIARSQLAAAIWNHLRSGVPAVSGGTQPGARVHPEALRAAARRGLNLRRARPRPVPAVEPADLVVTVCDRAHEALRAAGQTTHLHWSIPDPVAAQDSSAFDAAADMVGHRIQTLVRLVRSA